MEIVSFFYFQENCEDGGKAVKSILFACPEA